MTDLFKQECEACRADAPQVTDEELSTFMQQLPDWQPVSEKGSLKLRREFIFPNFVKALDLANRVGELAEEHGHHPDLLIEWGKCTVTWWSHEIKGLHKNDFILAAKTDRL